MVDGSGTEMAIPTGPSTRKSAWRSLPDGVSTVPDERCSEIAISGAIQLSPAVISSAAANHPVLREANGQTKVSAKAIP